ncbi:superoxide dismutase, Fe-Mn family [Flavobacterium anhuiense]|uniref:Superoxide dismutase n=1 Tax=Flavobacterium anhuiense TaxID=459526 RepID=A0ABY0LX61_9FLAO|nr:superoxide dismutase [Flavobacterium anhuiense]SCY75602.1 superoxide dismutase, Fe-Mn family [Flavobacterium anhuiense]
MLQNKILIVMLAMSLSVSAQFVQKPLPFAYNALEPFIDSQTMEIHYSRHHAGYVKNLNDAVKGTAYEKMTLEQLFSKASTLPAGVRNNAGGHYNHEMFWSILTPEKNTKLSAELLKALTATFGGLENLKQKLNKEALSRFGSGWVWLYVSDKKQLEISSTANQDNPLMADVQQKGTPILGIDLWEHAYYLKYQNKRADYLEAVWGIINWNEVSDRYHSVIIK